MKPPPVSSSARRRKEPAPCAECGSTSRVARGLCLNCLLYEGLGGDTCNPETLEDMLGKIDVRDADWRLGNYQILEEIGRGGMGVIYRARQRHSRRIVALMAKVARAVQYAHARGILHRDLKPANILLDGRGEPLVSDFGLAKWLDATSELTQTLAIFGTPGYIALEQASGSAGKITPAADVYSLGAILFHLFTGRPPFLGEHALAVIQQAAEKPAPKLRSLAPTLDRDLETICAKCLEREPTARYRSAGDLAIDLERWLEGRPIIARRVSPSARAWRWSKRNPKLAAATAAAFCAAAAAAFLFFSRNGVPPQSSLDSRLRTISSIPEKSVAVLPFENRSRDPDNVFFTDGVQDEILTDLARIADLKVISRTSVMQYK